MIEVTQSRMRRAANTYLWVFKNMAPIYIPFLAFALYKGPFDRFLGAVQFMASMLLFFTTVWVVTLLLGLPQRLKINQESITKTHNETYVVTLPWQEVTEISALGSVFWTVTLQDKAGEKVKLSRFEYSPEDMNTIQQEVVRQLTAHGLEVPKVLAP